MSSSINELTVHEALAFFREHWSPAYEVTCTPGIRQPWRARRGDDKSAVLDASMPQGLLDMIRADYQQHPVSRAMAS